MIKDYNDFIGLVFKKMAKTDFAQRDNNVDRALKLGRRLGLALTKG
jgi:hypothetical protein